MWIILLKIWYVFSVVWWGYCLVGTYKHFNELRYDIDKNRVAVGILAEVILLISSIIRLITV